jgi:hypothetical protein
MRISRLVATIAVALVVGACNDGGTTTTAAPTTSAPTTTTAAPTTSAAPSTTAAATPEDDLAALLRRHETTALRTTYVFSVGGEETNVVLAQDPGADPPLRAVIIPAADAKLITIGDESIFCDTQSNQCFAVPGDAGAGASAGLLGPFASGLFLAADLDAALDVERSGDLAGVAGRSGICFTFSAPANTGFDSGIVRQCIDTELGFTLLIQIRRDGSTESETIMELIEFGEPRDDDFMPTGEVIPAP